MTVNWAALGFWLGWAFVGIVYELWAVYVNPAGGDSLTHQVRLMLSYPPLRWMALGGWVWLTIHFFTGWGWLWWWR